MGSFTRKATRAALLAAALTTTQPAAYAETSAHRVTVILVPCSASDLTSAVAQANAIGAAVLRLSRRCAYGITTPLNFTGNVMVTGGPGTTIRQTAAANRVISVAAGGTLRAVGILIEGGTGAINGTGIFNMGTLVLRSVTVSGNAATGGGNGGGLANTGTAVISHSLFTGNTATGNGGAIENAVPGTLAGRLTLFASRVTGNTAPSLGGGVSTESGGVTRIIQSTISGNTERGAAFGGGGVGNNVGGSTSILRTLITRNQTAGAGGGVLNRDPAPNSVTIRRSRIIGNAPGNCSPVIAGCQG